MIYITGDRHRNFYDIFSFCLLNDTSKDDILIMLGDVSLNYFLDGTDEVEKKYLSMYPITFFCIHGNHEERPENVKGYKLIKYHEGNAYYEEKYPNIIFAQDGEIYNFNNQKVLVIGGAYSVDKYKRLANGDKWFSSEQPSEETKEKVRRVLEENNYDIDVVLSHTCPYKYIPREMFIPTIDQSTVDNSTELFLDEVEDKTNYKRWYCGHYHIDKEDHKMKMLYKKIEKF